MSAATKPIEDRQVLRDASQIDLIWLSGALVDISAIAVCTCGRSNSLKGNPS